MSAKELPLNPSPWALHRNLYQWVLECAHSKYAATFLFFLSLAESSFFPIAPDVLQIALTLERRTQAWKYAAISTIGSVLGGIIGYLIGMGIWHMASGFFFTYVFDETTFLRVGNLYNTWNFWAVFIAAFTPIPYKVFTIAAGVFQISPLMFIVASLIGRAARFFLVAGLLWRYGAFIKQFIETYFNVLTLLLVALLSLGFIMVRYL